MKKLFARLLFWRPKVVRSFAVHYCVHTYGDLVSVGVANYEVDSVAVALAMHRSDYPRTNVTHVIGYTWKEAA